MDVAKAWDTVWAKNLYKPSILNLQIYVVTIKYINPYPPNVENMVSS